MKMYNLTMREKYLSAFGLLLVVFFIYVFYFFMPISNATKVYKDKSYQARISILQLKKMLPRIERLKSQGASINFRQVKSLTSYINQQLNANPLKQRILSISGNSRQVTIKFGNVSFDLLIQWIQNLWQTAKISVSMINIQQTSVPGLVNVNMVFVQRAAGS